MNTDGTVGPQAEEVANFQQKLAARTSLPIDRRDERWTSTAVQREQQQAGRVLARGEEDSLAAQLLLESYINERSL
jgi:RNase H-fold protein (predicted Holliday junction resolvase)